MQQLHGILQREILDAELAASQAALASDLSAP
jgi:hypothetical protein